MRHPLYSLVLALLLIAPGVVPAASGGGSGGGGGFETRPSRRASPEELAQARYEKAMKKRDSALEHERNAAELQDEKKRERAQARARKDWEKAVDYYREAIEKKPDFHQAHSDLGYAYRKLGRYDESIAAYDQALSIAPGYPQAIEYRGEAYLHLNRLSDARQSYERLKVLDGALADQLMDAMRTWADTAQQERPAGLSQEQLDQFVSWLQARGSVSELSPDRRPRSGW